MYWVVRGLFNDAVTTEEVIELGDVNNMIFERLTFLAGVFHYVNVLVGSRIINDAVSIVNVI
jgi:hypothetical protein